MVGGSFARVFVVVSFLALPSLQPERWRRAASRRFAKPVQRILHLFSLPTRCPKASNHNASKKNVEKRERHDKMYEDGVARCRAVSHINVKATGIAGTIGRNVRMMTLLHVAMNRRRRTESRGIPRRRTESRENGVLGHGVARSRVVSRGALNVSFGEDAHINCIYLYKYPTPGYIVECRLKLALHRWCTVVHVI
jgi:hypothetical protein